MSKAITMVRFIVFSFVLVVLQACSGIQVSQDYDQGYNFASLKTFSWKPNKDNEYGYSESDLIDKRVRAAIENALIARKYVLAGNDTPDFYISYYITVEQRITSSNVSGGVSLGRSSRGRYGSIGISTGTQIHTYDEGTLLIDVTDVDENTLTWRGISTQMVDAHSDPEKTTERINETVEKMLAQFPPR